jgi:CDP-glucose 4,6-dehydratase
MTGDPGFWRGRRVLVTGHTGFKGTWLCAWLVRLGARVTGLALPPGPAHVLFERAGLEGRIRSCFGDLRDPDVVRNALRTVAPEVVLHLAAQALVLEGLRDPAGTFATNALGTVHLLEAIRATPTVRVAVIVTSDKCYRDGDEPCVEEDPLGGADPYSASKACAELVTAAWRSSFFAVERRVGLATARAGNVIGGGDFAADRLLPDLVRAVEAGRTPVLRNPGAVRPWQHVLDALSGYLALAEALARDPAAHARSWNFGPLRAPSWTVAEVAELALQELGGGTWRAAEPGATAEAPTLRLCSMRARQRLGWAPRLDTATAVRWTIEGYRALGAGEPDWLAAQIARYEGLGDASFERRSTNAALARA